MNTIKKELKLNTYKTRDLLFSDIKNILKSGFIDTQYYTFCLNNENNVIVYDKKTGKETEVKE
jgi:hypothetical protein